MMRLRAMTYLKRINWANSSTRVRAIRAFEAKNYLPRVLNVYDTKGKYLWTVAGYSSDGKVRKVKLSLFQRFIQWLKK